MKSWDSINCPNGQRGRQSDEAMQRMTLGELDALCGQQDYVA